MSIQSIDAFIMSDGNTYIGEKDRNYQTRLHIDDVMIIQTKTAGQIPKEVLREMYADHNKVNKIRLEKEAMVGQYGIGMYSTDMEEWY